ncbi:MAG TPA: NAD(P)/FAD-dependent oxidoreductase [Oculatellaceae cyanobacterium]
MNKSLQASLFASNHKVFDVIIIGGGPAGISCALELSFCNVESVLVDRAERWGGQLFEVYSPLDNFAAGYLSDGEILAKKLQEQLAAPQNAKILPLQGRNVQSIEAEKLHVSVDGEIYKARALVLCTGYRVRKLSVPGVSQFQTDIVYRQRTKANSGEKSSSSAPVRLTRIAVLGSGDNAVTTALELSGNADQVYLINRAKGWRSRSEHLELARSNTKIEIIENADLISLTGATKLTGAHLVDKASGRIRNLSFDKLYVRIGYQPNTEMFKNQVEMNETGHIITDRLGATSTKGVFAAGDIVAGSVARVATACGSGATAAESVMLYLGKRLG